MAASIVKNVEDTKDSQAPTTSKIKVTEARLGTSTKHHEVNQGTHLSEFLNVIGAANLEVRVNGEAAASNYVLKDGDVIVVVPEAVVGG